MQLETFFKGFFGVMGLGEYSSGARLTSPPIGVYKEDSGCDSRCSSYSYQLVEEEVAYYDSKMQV